MNNATNNMGKKKLAFNDEPTKYVDLCLIVFDVVNLLENLVK